MSAETLGDIPDSLERLAELLGSREHTLATGGDKDLAASALAATKGIFDLGLSLEMSSHPHLHPFLSSIMDPPPIMLRSSKAKVDAERQPQPEELLPYTPLGELTTEDMDPEQVWGQLELRNDGICKVVKEVGSGDAPGDEDDEEAEGFEDDSEEDEEDDDEEMTPEEWERMMADNGYMDGMSDSEGSGSEEGDSDELEGASDDDLEVGSDEGSEDVSEEGEDDDEGDEDDEEDEDAASGSDVDMDDGNDDQYAAGPSKPRKMHSTLDDQFFSIDEFNRLTEEQEAGRVTSGALGGDEDEDAELEDVGQMFLEEGDDDAEILYSDFFEPPKPTPTAGKDMGKSPSKQKAKRSKKSKVTFAEEEEEEDEPEFAERDIMDRVKGDLFDDSDDEEAADQPLSTHEKRQRALAEQIAQLEKEAIGPKDWTLLGEASARARPENSLLEEDLDFEHVAKAIPVVTEESVATLEELIKRRILDGQFDDPERVRAFEPTPFLPSRFFELQDTQSTKSLAQIYEDDFQAQTSGGAAQDPRDAKLKQEHEEIDRLWGEICYKLDALSSLHFVPKAPKAQISTIDNIATTSLETALPPTQAATSMLAPQEVFAGPKASELVARSEQTPEQAKSARNKARKGKKAERARLAATTALYGTKRKSVREEKEEALNNLVKTGKGVTVLGKGAKEDGKRRKREEIGVQDAKRLKL